MEGEDPAGLFEREYKVMSMFIENAKNYVQLSTGALVLSITFLHEVIGVPVGTKVPSDIFLIGSWVCFLIAVLSGAFYQYLAVKFLEWKSGVPRSHKNLWEWLVHHPWPVYGIMLVTFYGGAVLFTVAAIKRLGGAQQS